MRLRTVIILCFAFLCSFDIRAGNDIQKLCLEMTISEGSKLFIVHVKNGRKITAINKNNGQLAGKKVIRIDKRSFQQFKNNVVIDSKFYQLPELINCVKCSNAKKLKLTIKTPQGHKTIQGVGAEEANTDVRIIVAAIENMVGFIKAE